MCLGIPAKIVEITDAEATMAIADIAGVRREVNVSCIADGPLERLVGSYALIHVGFAMAQIDEIEAQRTLEALAKLGETQETLAAIQESAKILEA